MGRRPCCSKVGLNRGAWTRLEDTILTDYINVHGEGNWNNLPNLAGLKRCGKSCRLRWVNYLRPDIKRGNISEDEEDLILRMHKLLGNKWSLIAGRLPGRTDNEIKNYWNTSLKKKSEHRNPKTTLNSSNDEKELEARKPSVEPIRTKAFRLAKPISDHHPNHQLSSRGESVTNLYDDHDSVMIDSDIFYDDLPQMINISQSPPSDCGGALDCLFGDFEDDLEEIDFDFLASFMDSHDQECM